MGPWLTEIWRIIVGEDKELLETLRASATGDTPPFPRRWKPPKDSGDDNRWFPVSPPKE